MHIRDSLVIELLGELAVRLEYLHPVHQPVDEYHDDKNHHHSRK